MFSSFRITQNADRAPIDPENITYMLYMKSSFENLLVGDRVSVSVELPPSTGTKNKSKVLRGSGDYGSVSSASQFDYSLLAESSVAATLNSFNANYEVHSYCGKFFDDTLKRYGGEITRIR